MILKKIGKLVFNSLLVTMLLGILVLPISAIGLINVIAVPSLNSEVLSAQDEMKKSELIQTNETTQTTK